MSIGIQTLLFSGLDDHNLAVFVARVAYVRSRGRT